MQPFDAALRMGAESSLLLSLSGHAVYGRCCRGNYRHQELHEFFLVHLSIIARSSGQKSATSLSLPGFELYSRCHAWV
jgi:hypothetical protein